MHIFDLSTLDSRDYNCLQELVKNPNDKDAIDKAKSVTLKDKIIIKDGSIHYNNDKIFRMGFPHSITSIMDKGSTGMIWKSLILTSVLFILVIILMHRIFKYLNGNNKTLLEYRNMLKCDECKKNLLGVFKSNYTRDNEGKKIVSKIIAADSRISDYSMYHANIYFGLTSSTPQELCNLLHWAVENLEEAKQASEKDKIKK